MTAKDFFMKNLSVYNRVFRFASSKGININHLQNRQVAAIVISLYKLSRP